MRPVNAPATGTSFSVFRRCGKRPATRPDHRERWTSDKTAARACQQDVIHASGSRGGRALDRLLAADGVGVGEWRLASGGEWNPMMAAFSNAWSAQCTSTSQARASIPIKATLCNLESLAGFYGEPAEKANAEIGDCVRVPSSPQLAGPERRYSPVRCASPGSDREQGQWRHLTDPLGERVCPHRASRLAPARTSRPLGR